MTHALTFPHPTRADDVEFALANDASEYIHKDELEHLGVYVEHLLSVQ